jgi:hypothetical protein
MRRGTSNSNCRGSSYDRRRRRAFLIAKFGGPSGKTIKCFWCPKRMRASCSVWEVDRLLCGHKGGGYTRDNIVPSCPDCNKRRCANGCGVGALAGRFIARDQRHAAQAAA